MNDIVLWRVQVEVKTQELLTISPEVLTLDLPAQYTVRSFALISWREQIENRSQRDHQFAGATEKHFFPNGYSIFKFQRLPTVAGRALS